MINKRNKRNNLFIQTMRKGVKQNGRIFFNHFFSSAGSAFALYPLVEAQAQKSR